MTGGGWGLWWSWETTLTRSDFTKSLRLLDPFPHLRHQVPMLASLHRLIEFALELDQTLSLDDRETILTCCRSPAKFREKSKGPEERLLKVNEVTQMLSTSRTTIWRLCQTGVLKPVFSFSGSRKFRLSDIQALMAGNAPHGHANGLTGVSPKRRGP